MANFEQSGSRIPDAVSKTYTSTNSNLLSYKNTELKNLQHSSHNIALSKSTIIATKLQKNVNISKIKKAVCFLKLQMCVYLRTKFQFSGIILTSFRQNGPLKSPPRLGLRKIR